MKVLVVDEHGKAQPAVARLDKSGRGSAEFGFAEAPGPIKVIVGPDDADDDELVGMQTITVDVSPRQWRGESKLVLQPVAITKFYWHWWLRWCRTFTVRGRILCPDGSPVPGAVVTAFDTDFWWWWCSKQVVATATTDASGSFEMKFRWCCGWWPWWWWNLRRWEVEPHLAERILPVLYRELQLKRLPIPEPDPDPTLFERLLEQPGRFGPPSAAQGHAHAADPSARHGAAPVAKVAFDPTTLEQLREQVVKVVPSVPSLSACTCGRGRRGTRGGTAPPTSSSGPPSSATGRTRSSSTSRASTPALTSPPTSRSPSWPRTPAAWNPRRAATAATAWC